MYGVEVRVLYINKQKKGGGGGGSQAVHPQQGEKKGSPEGSMLRGGEKEGGALHGQ